MKLPTSATFRGEDGPEPVTVLSIRGDLARVRDRCSRDFWVSRDRLTFPGAGRLRKNREQSHPTLF